MYYTSLRDRIGVRSQFGLIKRSYSMDSAEIMLNYLKNVFRENLIVIHPRRIDRYETNDSISFEI